MDPVWHDLLLNSDFLPGSNKNDCEEEETGSGAGSVKKCHSVVPGPVTRL